MVFALRVLGSFRGSQDEFLGNFAHFVNDGVKGPVVGDGMLHFLGFLTR